MSTAVTLPGGLRFPLPTRRALVGTAVFVASVVVLKLVLVVLDSHGVIHASTPMPFIVQGAITGFNYGLLGVGLVLIYRTSRIINFAHGQMGAFAAAFFGLAATKWHLPYWVAFPVALAVGAAVGAAAEAGAVRRLRNAPRLMSVVATLGIGQFLVVFALVINATASAGLSYPVPPGMPTFSVGKFLVAPYYSATLFLSPLAVLVIGVFLKRSRFGLAIRAAAANPEAARMSGISASRMSTLSWGIAGALSAFAAIFNQPALGFSSVESFGPALLLPAMTAAVIGRMQSLPLALFGGVGLGIVENLLHYNYNTSGLVEMVMFVIILGTLLFQRQRGGREEDKGSWAAIQGMRPLPRALRELPAVRRISPVVAVGFIVVLALLPLVINNSMSVSVTGMMSFAIVGLSIGVLTGLGGQLTLGQFAVAAVGAVVSYQVSSRIGDFPLALLYAGLAAGAVSVLIGIPALRIRGLMLSVTTLGFALVTTDWLLGQSWMLGTGVDPGKPIVAGKALETGRAYYYFALAVFIIALVLAWNVRRGGFGRLLVAVRDNEDNARAFGVRASMVKLQGYLIGGFLAGIGGAAYGHNLSSISSASFPVTFSTDLVVMAVLGGVAGLSGPILGAAWVFGLPHLHLGNLALATTRFGILLVILWRPGGLIQIAEPVRNGLVSWIARRRGIDAAGLFAGGDDEPIAAGSTGSGATARVTEIGRERAAAVPSQRRPSGGVTLLEARSLGKRFGGVVAVKDVSLAVRAGETVGLIGPNGAGKTTTFELLGGFTRPDRGRVWFNRRDISYLSPEERVRLGLVRSFQDAALFPTMTVEETVKLAFERIQPTPFFSTVVGLNFGERGKERQAAALIATMGLERYRDKQIRELSTGTRRITEIACLVALEPVCLLLDEPSSGIAQRETEALGRLLAELKEQLELTLVVIEHDIPLIMGISDRIVAMADGTVIAEGTPDEVRKNPLVVDAYLGASSTAIERSGAAVPGAPQPVLASNGSRPAAKVDVPGLGPARAQRLLDAFGSWDAVASAGEDDLRRVEGVGPALARRIHTALRDREH